jgi:hypothetical protein
MSKFGVVTMITIVLVALWTVAFLLNYIFGCGKYVTALWGNVLLAADECPNGFKNEMALFASDLATDLIVLLLPVPVVCIKLEGAMPELTSDRSGTSRCSSLERFP